MTNQDSGPGWGSWPGYGPPPERPSTGRRLVLVLVAVVVAIGVTAAAGFALSSGGSDDSGGRGLFADPGSAAAPSSEAGSAPAATRTAVTDQDEEQLRTLCTALQKVGAPYVPGGTITNNVAPSAQGNKIDAGCDFVTPGQAAVSGFLSVVATTFAPLSNYPAPEQACRTRLASIIASNPLPAVANGSTLTYAGVVEQIIRMGTVRTCVGDLMIQLDYGLTRYQPSPARPVLADPQLLARARTITTALAAALS